KRIGFFNSLLVFACIDEAADTGYTLVRGRAFFAQRTVRSEPELAGLLLLLLDAVHFKYSLCVDQGGLGFLLTISGEVREWQLPDRVGRVFGPNQISHQSGN